MTNTKRKLNKLKLINARLYTVTGNKGVIGHHFIKVEVVRFIGTEYGHRDYCQSVTTGLQQYVSSTDII